MLKVINTTLVDYHNKLQHGTSKACMGEIDSIKMLMIQIHDGDEEYSINMQLDWDIKQLSDG